MESENEPAIRCDGVHKRYRLYASPTTQALDALGLTWLKRISASSYTEFTALHDVNLRIMRGERVGIIGANGAGKTTLLKLISGNFTPTEGDLHVDGRVQALMQTGMGFHPEFSGLENIRSALLYNGLIGPDLEEAVVDVIEFVELGEFLRQPVKTYSLGMNARLQFAVATAIRPDILIVDEILSAGDAYFAAKCAARMKGLTSGSCTLLLVSHSGQQILQFCSRAIWLEHGRVEMDGPASKVIGAYEVEAQRRIQAEKRRQEEAERETDPVQSAASSEGNYKSRSWLARRIAEAEKRDGEKRTGEFSDTLEDGRVVFRWPSERGVKFVALETLADGVEGRLFRTGGQMTVKSSLMVETTGPMRCRYYASVFGVDGKRLAWLTSPEDTFDGEQGDRRIVEFVLSPLLLGAGDYILSISVFDATDPVKISEAVRYDLLARCLEFRVVEHDGRDPPVFHHPTNWSFQNTRSVAARPKDSERAYAGERLEDRPDQETAHCWGRTDA